MTDDRMRITEPLSSEGTCGGRLVLPCCSQPGQLGRLLGALFRQVLNTSKDEASTASLGNPFCSLITLTIKKKKKKIWNFPYFPLCPLPLVLPGTNKKSLAPPSVLPHQLPLSPSPSRCIYVESQPSLSICFELQRVVSPRAPMRESGRCCHWHFTRWRPASRSPCSARPCHRTKRLIKCSDLGLIKRPRHIFRL